MVSRNMGDYYDTTCHVIDPDTVIVQGMRFIKEQTCEFDSQAGGKRRCKRCGAFVSVYSVFDCFGCIPARYCPHCGAKVVECD